jgi:hypothetical protein
MEKYTVQAQLGIRTGVVIFRADGLIDATMQAIDIIMEHATWSDVWAKGAITLSDSAGNVLQTMDAKVIN